MSLFEPVSDAISYARLDEQTLQRQLDELQEKYKGSLRIDFDTETQQFKVGNFVIEDYTTYQGCYKFAIAMLREHGLVFNSHPRWVYKQFSALFGIGPSKAFTHFKKAQYKYLVAPHLDVLARVAFKPGRIDQKALKQIKMKRHVLDPVVNDKLYNILPIVLATGKSPQELKKALGGTWKTLCKNSLNKNSAVVKNFTSNWVAENDSYLDYLKDRATLPTTVLQTYKGYYPDVMKHLTTYYKGTWKKLDLNTTRLVGDTKRLATQIEAPFDPLWTPRKMKEKHDQYAREVNALRYSPAKIEWLKPICHVFQHEGYAATLLDSRALVAEEGTVMGHCVGGYAESVAEGHYLVYSITKDGERSSTLGISVKGNWHPENKKQRYFTFNQHYLRFNKPVTDEYEKELAKLLIEHLNKTEKEKYNGTDEI